MHSFIDIFDKITSNEKIIEILFPNSKIPINKIIEINKENGGTKIKLSNPNFIIILMLYLESFFYQIQNFYQ